MVIIKNGSIRLFLIAILIVILLSTNFGIINVNGWSEGFVKENAKLQYKKIVYPKSPQPNNEILILADGQFVNGPNVGNFDIYSYLQKINSPLIDNSFYIEDNAHAFSINPKLLLTLIEFKTGLVTNQNNSLVLDEPFGYPNVHGFKDELAYISEELFNNFYDKLYNEYKYNDKTYIKLESGNEIVLNSDINAASYAILLTIAPIINEQEFENFISLESKSSFVNIFKRLFPNNNPLDNSNNIIPNVLVPEDFLKLPFKGGDTWRFTGGPHKGNYPNYTSLDFAPGVAQCTVPSDRWIVSPADGIVTYVGCGGCRIEIAHGPNWKSYFYHVANPKVVVGQTVSKNQKIGNPSQRPHCTGNCGGCGGDATGVHVHYTILYNGAAQPMDGQLLENWRVHAVQTEYRGYLERNGVIKDAASDDPIKSDYLKPVSTVSINGSQGQNGWYVSDVLVTITAMDTVSGVRQIQYNIDNNGWTEYFSPFVITTNGMHSLSYRSKDWSGNLEDAQSTTFMIDTAAPTNPIFINPGCNIYSDVWQNYCNDLFFSWSGATDNASGVSNYEYYWGIDPFGSTGTITTDSFFDPTPVPIGVYYFRIHTKDYAGNWSNWITLFILKYQCVLNLPIIYK